ncbi:MAG: 5-bromo-4-chloroindolyl phosphate hydrolysis family protein [Bacillaceae bacterium]
MSSKKRKQEPDLSGLYIPIGLFLGLGTGILLGGKFVPVFLFLGLGGGFYLLLISQRRRHRRIIQQEEQLLNQTQIKEESKPQIESQSQNVSSTYLESTLQNYREGLLRIGNLAKLVPAEKKKVVDDIILLLDKVGTYVEKEPSRYSATKVFFQTYISSTEKILEKYVMLLDQPVMNESAAASISKIDTMLVEMKSEYEEAYVKLYEEDVNQLNVEMEMLRNKFKEEKTIKWP